MIEARALPSSLACKTDNQIFFRNERFCYDFDVQFQFSVDFVIPEFLTFSVSRSPFLHR